MPRSLYFCTISSYVCLYVYYYVVTCSLCVVFLGQACVLYIDFFMCFLSLKYLFRGVCAAICRIVRVLSEIWDCVCQCVCRSCVSYFY
jgi:hypothetical protein